MYCLVPERKYYVSIDLIWIGGCDFHEDLLGSLSNQRPPRCCQRGRLLCAATINLCHSSGFIKSCSYHEKCSAATQLFPSCPQGVFFSRPLCKSTTNRPQRWPRRSVLCFCLSVWSPQLNTPQSTKRRVVLCFSVQSEATLNSFSNTGFCGSLSLSVHVSL